MCIVKQEEELKQSSSWSKFKQWDVNDFLYGTITDLFHTDNDPWTGIWQRNSCILCFDVWKRETLLFYPSKINFH